MKEHKKGSISRRKMAASVGASLLAAAIIIPATMAYLTDNETAVNTFTVGTTSIETEEPGWDLTDTDKDGVPDAAENVVPNQEITKDPRVKNTGNNDAIIFMRVTVPVKDVTLIGDNGKKVSSHKAQELFYLKTAATPEAQHQNVFNTGSWIELPSKEVNNGATQTVGQRTYVFAYRTRLAKSVDKSNPSISATLFDKVQVKNILENEVASDQMNNIKVETWAIQADNIAGDGSDPSLPAGKTIDTTSLDNTKLNYIYDVFVNQNGHLSSDGSMVYSTYQDAEHGSVEHDASASGNTDVNGSIIHSKLKAAIDTSYLTPAQAETPSSLTPESATKAAEGSGYTEYPNTAQMTVTFLQDSKNLKNHTLTYTSSDKSVATVNDRGLVTAVNEGEATITAEASDGATVSINIHVVKDSRKSTGNVAANDADDRPQGTTQP